MIFATSPSIAGHRVVDPVTRQRVRVVIDPANGERRYIAEG